jgi:aspartate-semialdehyde dehydrogenase
MNAMTQTTTPVSVKGDTHPALSQLRDPRLLREMAYIDGRWTAAAGDARL